MRIESKAMRESARGEDCTLRIPGMCNFDTETTILAHLPDESHGMSRKSDDISSAYCCSRCHDAIDGRVNIRLIDKQELQYIMRRAQTRTIRRMIEKGIISIKGFKA